MSTSPLQRRRLLLSHYQNSPCLDGSCSLKTVRQKTVHPQHFLTGYEYAGDSFEGRPAAIPGENVIIDPSVAYKTHSKTAQKILRAQKQPAAPTLFFGNLGFETTEDSIRQLLQAHREPPKVKGKAPTDEETGAEEEQKQKQTTTDVWIRKIRMGTFEDSGACKGYVSLLFRPFIHIDLTLLNLVVDLPLSTSPQ